jgi:dihydrofolate reductase
MHISLDGFAAGPNGEMEWINVDDTIFDIASRRTKEADTALYGRVTFEMMDSYWPTAGEQSGATKHDIEHSTWYKNVDKVVMSRSMKVQELNRTTVISDSLAQNINEIKRRKGKISLCSEALVQHIR